jgi:hypothetical protein
MREKTKKQIAVIWARDHAELSYGLQVEILNADDWGCVLINSTPYQKRITKMYVSGHILWTDEMGYVNGTAVRV